MSDYDSLDGDDAAARVGVYSGARNEQGQRHGYGKATLRNNNEYVGEYRNGERHGFGKYKFENGARYMQLYSN